MGLLSSIAGKLFSGIGGIVRARKDLVQTDESKLKIGKLEHEKSERESEIQRANLEDVKKYDPKHAKLERAVRKHFYHRQVSSPIHWFGLVIIVVIAIVYHLVRWLFS